MKESRFGDGVSRLIPARVAVGMCMVWAGSSLAAELTNKPITFARDVVQFFKRSVRTVIVPDRWLRCRWLLTKRLAPGRNRFVNGC